MLIAVFGIDKKDEFDGIKYIDDLYATIYTDEWRAIESGQLRARKLQTPENVLVMMTADELVYAVIHYPFNGDILAYDILRYGFLHIYYELAALHELVNREDAPKAWIEAYFNFPVVSESEVDFDNYLILRLEFLEIMLVQPEVTGNFTQKQLKRMDKIADEKYRQKLESETYFYKGLYYLAAAEAAGFEWR